MGATCSNVCYDDFTIGTMVCPIKPEDIHKTLSEMYSILTDCNMSFEERNKEIHCLEKKYRCYVNINYPYKFSFNRDCFCYEYFTYIATIGDYSINLFAYSDLYGWVVCNTGSSYMKYDYGGCSKLQLCVSKRKQLLPNEQANYELKMKEIERRRLECDFCRTDDSFIDWRSKPRCDIIEPRDKAQVEDSFGVLVRISNWNMKEGGLHARVFIDDQYIQSIYSIDMFYLNMSEYKKGWHKLTIKLYDETDTYIGISSEKRICLLRESRSMSDDSCKKCRRRKCECSSVTESTEQTSTVESSNSSSGSEVSIESNELSEVSVETSSRETDESTVSAESVIMEISKEVQAPKYNFEKSFQCTSCNDSESSSTYIKYRSRGGYKRNCVKSC